MTLPDTIRNIQRHYGLDPDGVAGTLTFGAIWRDIQGKSEVETDPEAVFGIDDRSAGNLATLDPKAQPLFASFLRRAKATAATFGCDYVLIGGNRTHAEQDALYAQGRTVPGERVTNAKGGQSNHNFGIAGDCGVFQGKRYLDEVDPRLAAKVHAACSLQAMPCGLEWGGSWQTFKDAPHYQVATGLTLAQCRARYAKSGSVLS